MSSGWLSLSELPDSTAELIFNPCAHAQRRVILVRLCIGRLISRLVGQSVGWSVGRSVGWSVSPLVGWSVGQSVSLSVYLFVRTFSPEPRLWWIPNLDIWVGATDARHSKRVWSSVFKEQLVYRRRLNVQCGFLLKAESGGYQTWICV